MSERRRRGGRERDDYRESHGWSDREYGRDQPWREERRERYPDEPYGGGREMRRSFEPGPEGSRYYGERGRERYGRGDRPGQARENYERDDAGWSGRGEWRGDDRSTWRGDEGRSRGDDWSARSAEGWRRGHMGGGGFGSEYGAWRSGAGFGFGPEERPEGGFEDSDWVANRPARGRGAWSGDWAERPEDRPTAARTSSFSARDEYRGREDYSGRGPKDYRRSDDRIREEVCDRLTDDPGVDAENVNIMVESGDVTLSGTVNSRDQKRRAEECIERVSGVREVINQLRVNRGESAMPGMMAGTSAGSGSALSTQAQSSARPQRAGASTQPGVAADRDRER